MKSSRFSDIAWGAAPYSFGLNLPKSKECHRAVRAMKFSDIRVGIRK